MLPLFTGGVVCGLAAAYLSDNSDKPNDEVKRPNSETITEISRYTIPPPASNFIPTEEFKMVIGVRTDLKYKLYKTATSLGDVVIKAIKNAVETKNELLSPWYYYAQAKICTKVPNLDEMLQLIESASKANVPYVTLTDDENGEICAIALGPSYISNIDPISRHLKLM